MNLDSKLFQAFGRETEIPAPVQARLEASYDNIRKPSGEEENMKAKPVIKFSRGLLIAAVLVSLLTVTALAAYRGSMQYRLNEEHETFEYRVQKGSIRYSPSLVLSFDAPEESSCYFFQADWLPEKAGSPSSAVDDLNRIASNTVYSEGALDEARRQILDTATAEKRARYEKYPMALTQAAQQNLKERQYAELERLIEQMGMTREELASWHSSVISQRITETELPYTVSLFSPATLHGKDFLLGHYSEEVEVVEESEEGDWYTLKIAVDYSSREPFAFPQANYIFRYHRNEGYLLLVYGTSDFETLERIVDNLRVREIDSIPCRTGDYEFSVLDIGRG